MTNSDLPYKVEMIQDEAETPRWRIIGPGVGTKVWSDRETIPRLEMIVDLLNTAWSEGRKSLVTPSVKENA